MGLIRKSVSTFQKFPTGERMVVLHMCLYVWGAFCKFDSGIALFTYSNISINSAVCLLLTQIEVFPQICFPFHIWDEGVIDVMYVCHVAEKKFCLFRELWHLAMWCPEITMDNGTGIPY